MRAVAERTIVLSDEDAALLDRLVADGGYRDADEALHQSLELADLAQGDARRGIQGGNPTRPRRCCGRARDPICVRR
jgi:hypothetical protein